MATPTGPWWSQVQGNALAQGDYLPGCLVPFFGPEFTDGAGNRDVLVKEYDCIVLTQSCDLENDKASLVALCPIHPLASFEEGNPHFARKGAWEEVRKGRAEGLHLVASMREPGNNRACLVVDFREIYSLPIAHLKRHAGSLGLRWRLCAPYLEHFSQAFARFFMRVGLPGGITPFN